MLTPSEVTSRILAGLRESGGASVNPHGAGPVGGYMVALPGHERVIRVWSPDTRAPRYGRARRAGLAYVFDHWSDVAPDPALYFGAWLDNGRLYLDVSERVATRELALAKAAHRNELAIYDVANGASVYVSQNADTLWTTV
jgi:hypothetical protein